MDQLHVLESIDARVIGERLAEARRARRMTQQQAADTLGVARTTVVAMEKGDRRPRAAELHQLARLYGRSIGEFVRPEHAASRPDFVVQFRAIPGATSESITKRETDLRRFEMLCRWYVELEEMLEAPLPHRYPSAYDISGTPVEHAAAEVASAERNRLGLGDGPISDLWGVLETDIGLRVFVFPMSDGRIAGIFLFTEQYGGCVAINANHPEERRRWSAAHELGHFLTDRHRPELTVLTTTKRVPERERFADAFARCFLMPADGLRRRFEAIRRSKSKPITPADVLSLSHLYRVSFQAMTWRLEELKLLPAGTWESLKEKGFKPREAAKLLGIEQSAGSPGGLPLRYEALAVQAFLEDRISEGQLAERLVIDRVGARERVVALTTQPVASEEGEWRQVSLDLSAALVAS
jgi:Zn-dependent peptidase ImmA (M78 family)/transcriptional regulator with XRE-family HTH domain